MSNNGNDPLLDEQSEYRKRRDAVLAEAVTLDGSSLLGETEEQKDLCYSLYLKGLETGKARLAAEKAAKG